MFESAAPRIMPFDLHDPSLALYLPFWYPAQDISGASIKSYDKYRRAFTVTNGPWSTTGRVFAGGDDKIVSNAAITLTDTAGLTMIAWVNWAINAASRMVLFGEDAITANTIFWERLQNSNQMRVLGHDGDANQSVLTSANWLLGTDNIWTMLSVAIDFTGDVAYYYKNTTTESTAALGITFPSAAKVFYIGSYDADLTHPFTGTYGEFIMFSRVLSAGEIANIYDATRWRYK